MEQACYWRGLNLVWNLIYSYNQKCEEKMIRRKGVSWQTFPPWRKVCKRGNLLFWTNWQGVYTRVLLSDTGNYHLLHYYFYWGTEFLQAHKNMSLTFFFYPSTKKTNKKTHNKTTQQDHHLESYVHQHTIHPRKSRQEKTDDSHRAAPSSLSKYQKCCICWSLWVAVVTCQEYLF